MMTAGQSTARAGEQRARPGLEPATRRLIGVLLAGAVLPLLDATIVNVAVEHLTGVFNAPVSAVQWVITGYAMATALAIPLSAWAVRRFGGKQMWLLSLVLFGVGSVLCGMAWDVASLIAFRVVQGLGGGMSMPVLQTLLVRSAGRDQARRAMAAIGIPAVVAPVAGPVLGGVIMHQLNWSWMFYINVPLCLLAIVLAAKVIPATPPDRDAVIDARGFLLLAPALVALVYALSQADHPAAFTSPQLLITGGAGLVLLAAFAFHAIRSPRRPLVDIRLFRVPSFTGAAGTMLMTGIVFYAGLILLPLYYQDGLGYSVLGAGLVLAVQGIGALVARSAIGGVTERIGVRGVVIGGALLAALGTVPFTGMTAHGDVWALIGLLVRGAGVGVVTVAAMGAVYHGIDQDAIPDASSISRILLQFGGALGAAAATTVLIWQQHASGSATGAFHATFWWLLAATAATALPALLLPGKQARRG